MNQRLARRYAYAVCAEIIDAESTNLWLGARLGLTDKDAMLVAGHMRGIADRLSCHGASPPSWLAVQEGEQSNG